MKQSRQAHEYRIITPLAGGGQLLQIEERCHCAACGRWLERGEHVTRHRVPGVDGSNAKVCRECYPFRYRVHYTQTYHEASTEPVTVSYEDYWKRTN